MSDRSRQTVTDISPLTLDSDRSSDRSSDRKMGLLSLPKLALDQPRQPTVTDSDRYSPLKTHQDVRARVGEFSEKPPYRSLRAAR